MPVESIASEDTLYRCEVSWPGDENDVLDNTTINITTFSESHSAYIQLVNTDRVS